MLLLFLSYLYSFFLKFYHLWQINAYQRRHEHEKRLRANYHYRIHLQRICFNAWLTYTEYRRKKNLHKSKKMLFEMFFVNEI
jgi:hypothetical protein